MNALTPEAIHAFLSATFPAADAVRCESIGDHEAVVRWVLDPSKLRPGGLISGPTQFTLADTALYFAVFSVLGRIEPMAVTSELSIRFLRPASGGDLLARGRIQSAGRRRLVGSVELWVDGEPDRLVSVAQGTYVPPRG